MSTTTPKTKSPAKPSKRYKVTLSLLPAEARMLTLLADHAHATEPTAARAAIRDAYKHTFRTDSQPSAG